MTPSHSHPRSRTASPATSVSTTELQHIPPVPFWQPPRYFFCSNTPETEQEVLVSAQERRQKVEKFWYQAFEVPAGGQGEERRRWVVAALSAGSVPRAGGRWPQCRHGVAWAQSGFARRSGRGNFETRQRENKPPHSTASANTPPLPAEGCRQEMALAEKSPLPAASTSCAPVCSPHRGTGCPAQPGRFREASPRRCQRSST